MNVFLIFINDENFYRLLRTLGRHMKTSDLFELLSSPFWKRTLNRKPELPAWMIDLGLTAPIESPLPERGAR